MSPPKIFVAGSFIAGITIRVPRQPVPGETLLGDRFNMGPGGKGFNQAVAASRAGAEVAVMFCTGRDMFAGMAKKALETENISTKWLLQMDDVYTGCGMVTLLHSGENSIVIDTGANDRLTAQMINNAADKIAGSKIVMAQLEIPDEAVEKALFLGKKNRCITMLNPAPARIISAEILKYTDILTPNETESKILLGLPPDDDTPVKQLARQLLQCGVKTIVMTMGKQGAMIITKNGIIDVPAPYVQPFDSTGAGDCFNGNLAYALATGIPVKAAVQRAVYAGAFCTQYLGVIDGMPRALELNNYITQFTS